VPERVEQLFDEYARAYARGERPEAREYLERAGPDADALAGLIDRYLAGVPAPAPDERTVELFEAWHVGESPLLRLRTAQGVKRDTVVAALVKKLGLDPKKATKVKRYYHELESGLLEPEQVDRRVFEVLAETLGARAADLVAWRRRTAVFPATAYARADEPPGRLNAPVVIPEPDDEIDRLFHTDRK
jgi:hypothetical protein